MNEPRANLKRQVEILGLALGRPGHYKILDLEMYFDCSRPTILRDLKELRNMGIDIHSVSGKGISLASSIKEDILRQMLEMYLWLSQTELIHNKGINFLVSEMGEKALTLLVTLQKCIENRQKLEISYKKYDIPQSRFRIINPLLLFEKENSLRLLAEEGGAQKQFEVDKIVVISPLRSKFIPPSDSYKEVIKSSFGTRIGERKYEIEIKFTLAYLKSGKNTHLMPDQESSVQPDGSILVRTKVNSLEEIAR